MTNTRSASGEGDRRRGDGDGEEDEGNGGGGPPPPGVPPGMSRGEVLRRLFLEYFKIALFVVGGGYAIIVAADDVFGRRLRWLAEGELLDRLPVIQAVPGMIAGNSAVYVGLKVAGLAGAAVAVVAVALPSFVIIAAIACGYSWLPVGNPFLQGAFLGLRCSLAGLVLGMVVKAWRRNVRGVYGYAMLALGLVLILVAGVGTALVLAGAMLAGTGWFALVRPLLRRAPRERGGGA